MMTRLMTRLMTDFIAKIRSFRRVGKGCFLVVMTGWLEEGV
jgi:hypothetical protein